MGHSPLGLCWSCALNVHLVDSTYELFRHYYALLSARDRDGREVAAVRGVLASMLGMISDDATHIAIATDHVIWMLYPNTPPPGHQSSPHCERFFHGHPR